MKSHYIYKTIGFGRIYVNKNISKDINHEHHKDDTKSHETKSPLLEQLKAFYDTCKNCKKCKLSEQRTQVVFGDGNPDSRVLFVGEAPGADEDIEGRPFVGKAGKLLTSLLESIGLLRERDYYITNVAKCRPPNNRTPEEEEMIACSYILKQEIKLINPKLIVALGKTAAVGLSGNKQISPTKQRGTFVNVNLKSPVLEPGKKIFVTYHPSFLLRNQSELENFKKDLLMIKELIKNS